MIRLRPGSDVCVVVVVFLLLLFFSYPVQTDQASVPAPTEPHWRYFLKHKLLTYSSRYGRRIDYFPVHYVYSALSTTNL